MGQKAQIKPARGRVSAKDVADKLGVSVSTVSRALSESTSISRSTREKVMAAAKELGYQPDPFASGMTSQHSNIVCVLVSEIANPFFPELVAVIADELSKLGFNVMLFHIDSDSGEEAAIRDALRYRPKFILVTTVTMTFRFSEPDLLKETKLICLNRYVPKSDYIAVTCDNFKGGYELADLLIRTGHRHPAYVAGTPDASTSFDRGAGFIERCRMANLSVEMDDGATSFSYECGYESAVRLIKRAPQTDCIFCANDIMAMGVIDAIRYELGKHVPEDISVAGFDDVQMASWPSVELTTYRYPKKKMIAELVDLIGDLEENPGQSPVNRIVTGEVIARKTHMARRTGQGAADSTEPS